MTRRLLAPSALLCVAALAAAGCGGSKKSSQPPATTSTGTTTSSAGGTLDGSVGPGFNISLSRNGQPVTTLEAGTYTLKVDDQADIHDFHLTGPGVDVSTEVSLKGTKNF